MNAKPLFVGLLVVALAGCAGAQKGRAVRLDFLIDGETTREETGAKLGQPSATFVGGEILTYRIGFDSQSRGHTVIDRTDEPECIWPPSPPMSGDQAKSFGRGWLKARYSLVLVFDGRDVLRRHALVEVKP